MKKGPETVCSLSTCRVVVVGCGCYRESDSVRARQARQAPPSMPWEEFVKILTFNAKRKVVKADPKQ